MSAVENGAVVVYAHMALNAGFPHLFPVLEGCMDGLPVGEAYQRLINALIDFQQLTSAELSSRDVAKLNNLLYVIIGDPALQPLAKMTPLNTPIIPARPSSQRSGLLRPNAASLVPAFTPHVSAAGALALQAVAAARTPAP